MNLITLFLTCASATEAQKISGKLLDEKLAACVRQTDVKSDFWWKGEREQADEVLLMIESSQEKFDQIEAAIKQVHSYETFVLTAYAVAQSSAGVERWVKEVIG